VVLGEIPFRGRDQIAQTGAKYIAFGDASSDQLHVGGEHRKLLGVHAAMVVRASREL
jgi:hypothetical protein